MELQAGVYARQSHAMQKSIEDQLKICATDAEREGMSIVATYQDGRSASRHAKGPRDEWGQIQTDIEAGTINVVVLWESSRGDRTLDSWAMFLALCRRLQVRIRVTEHRRTYLPWRARDWRSLAEDGVDSAYEVEKTSGRAKRGIASAAVAGKPHGQIPYGYTREYDSRKELLRQYAHPDEAPIVMEIFDRIKKGDPIITIQRDLNDRGIPAPYGGQWSRKTVRGIALNDLYIGRRVHRSTQEDEDSGNVVPVTNTTSGIWDGLVDEAIFLRVRQILTDPKRKTTRPGRVKHLLSYLAQCGECGGPMHAQAERSGRQPRYACHQNSCTTITMGDLDEYVTAALIKHLATLELPKLVASADAECVAARLQAQRLREDRDEALDSVGKPDGFTLAEARRIASNLRPKIEAAEQRARDAATPPILAGLVTATDLTSHVTNAPISVRREAVAAFLSVAVFRPERRGGRWHAGTPVHERVTITRRVGTLASPATTQTAS